VNVSVSGRSWTMLTNRGAPKLVKRPVYLNR
jgi:hypothetical protein